MRKFELNKLVRDGVVGRMEAAEQQVVYRQLAGAELLRAAGCKVQEETAEFDPANPSADELADILEATDAVRAAVRGIARGMGIVPGELENIRAERRRERGGFEDGTYVETVTLADDDPWADYYAKDPDRFKEVTDNEI